MVIDWHAFTPMASLTGGVLISGEAKALVFVAALATGMVLFGRWDRRP